ncbi:8-amino-7-oxononanoate synthase [Thalassoroseus pseudoceratinae]|uniref:8-amino-7-oxononanoate synthase n=1 Tax=Thalassoroseus pseudoceratinae TaxID=2713176 RepID=UPI00141DCE01|nr:8-amino-7-oxononanoate synthase [Thalassoroseus pseudoceratinae]
MSRSLPWLDAELEQLQADGLKRKRSTIDSSIVSFASNDYLGLSRHPRVIAAAHDAINRLGVGAGASALVTGYTDCHRDLETTLAKFEREESAILFPSGYAANVGTLAALIDSEDIVFCDRLNHASLIDGCRLSRASFQVYRHDQLDRLEQRLKRATGHRRRYIVTDSIFSMDGHAADLRTLCKIAERTDAEVIVDEAHATGLLGENGRGVAELQGVTDRVAVRIGTLSKAIGTLGGFVTGTESLTDWLWNSARSQMFSTALPPSVCAAATEAVHIVQAEPERRHRVLSLANSLRSQLTNAGFSIPSGGVSAIVPVVIGDPDTTMQWAAELKRRGFLVGAIRPPTVPVGTSRLRIAVHADHTDEDINGFCNCLCEVRQTARTNSHRLSSKSARAERVS